MTWLLDPSVTFLNHGSFGSCPEPVFRRYQELQLELEREPVDFIVRSLDDRLHSARSVLAAAFGGSAEGFAFVTNTTTGVNFVARSLPPGEVLSTDHEYGTIDMTWRTWGHTLVNVSLQLPVSDYVEEVWAAVTPSTRVICLSQISSPTGLVFPVAEVVRRARERGILTVVDGAHVPGQLALDLSAMGADFYVANLHKWLCAPKGAAFLYASSAQAQSLIKPLVQSWPSRKHSTPYLDAVMNQGTRDLSAWLAAPAALEFCLAHHTEDVRGSCRDMAREGRQQLLELVGTAPLAGEEWLAQMAAVELPAGTDPIALHEWLRREKAVEVPCWWWNGRPLLRFSICSYNRFAHVERLVEGVQEYLAL